MPSGKMNNRYKLNLQEVKLKTGAIAKRSLNFEFENRDDIFSIIDLVSTRNLFSDENESFEFILGLRLLGEVILKNQKNPLLKSAFIRFMRNAQKA